MSPSENNTTTTSSSNNNDSTSSSRRATTLNLKTEHKPLALMRYLSSLITEKECGYFTVVDDNARMHRTQSYYRIELTSSLPSEKHNKWSPQDPVVGIADNTKDRWGLLVKKNSAISLDSSKNAGSIDDELGPSADASSSEFFLKKPNRRGSIDFDDEFTQSPSGSSRASIRSAMELMAAADTSSNHQNKSERKQVAKHKATKSKPDSNDQEKRWRNERKARKKKKQKEDDDEDDDSQTRKRRSPQKWKTLLNRSESQSFQRRTNTTSTFKTSMGKRKSAPSIFSPMCKSTSLAPPSRTFSPPWTEKTAVDMSDFLDHSEAQDDDDLPATMARIPKPNLDSDDDDEDEGFKGIETRRSAASYNAIFDMIQSVQTLEATTASEYDDEEEEESLMDDDDDELEYEIPLENSPRSRDTARSSRDAAAGADVSNRSERTTESFQRKPPAHTNSFELTHRRSAVRQSVRRRVVKMTPQELQSRIMDIQLTDEAQQQMQMQQEQQQQEGISGSNALLGIEMDYNDDDDDDDDENGIPIHPPTLCENDYTSSGENDYTSSGENDYTSSAEDEFDESD
ncbi:MAG: hypothetical protein SGBAC_007800 [Bacillariaceae sp.]